MPNDQSFDTRTTNPANRSVQAVGLSVAAVASGGGGGNDAPFQLAANQYTASRFPLQWVNPNGNETTRSAYNYTHSQFNYVRSVTVTGGSPPYHFDLVSDVTGVTITKKAPSWNPFLYLWAELVINPSQYASGASFTIRCTDQEGTVLTLAMSVTEDDSKFVFMDSVNGSSGNTGTLASPFADLGDIYGTLDSDATYQDKIIVGRQGTGYTIDNFDTGNNGLAWNSNKPAGWIPYPGESIEFTVTSNVVVGGAIENAVDLYFGSAVYNGGDSTAANTRVFAMLAGHDRIVWDGAHFKDTPRGTSGNDNPAGIFASDSAAKHKNISLIDIQGTRMATGQILFDLYAVEGFTSVGGGLSDSDVNNGAYCKGANTRGLIAGFDAWDNTTGRGLMFAQQADAGLLNPSGVVQYLGCRGFKTDDGINGTFPMSVGDSNQSWGTVYMDRITLVGKSGLFASLGTPNLADSIVINDDSEIPAGFNQTNNLTDNRTNLSNYLDASGDVLTGRADYGTVGANFVEPS